MQQKHQPIYLTLFGFVKFNYAIVIIVSHFDGGSMVELIEFTLSNY